MEWKGKIPINKYSFYVYVSIVHDLIISTLSHSSAMMYYYILQAWEHETSSPGLKLGQTKSFSLYLLGICHCDKKSLLILIKDK